MRQSDIMGPAANDNPKPKGQGDLFAAPREIVIGPISIGEPIADFSGHADGLVVVHEILERGGDVPRC